MAAPALTTPSSTTPSSTPPPTSASDDSAPEAPTLKPRSPARMREGLDPKLVVEAALFSAGKPLSVEEISENTGLGKRETERALEALEKHYREAPSSLEVSRAGRRWGMQVRAQYAERTTRLAPMEVSIKTLKTLALVAYHQPILQSDLMEMVGAKVYDHVKELVALGLIRKRVHERSFMLVTTERFPEYFGIPGTDREEIKLHLARKVGIPVPDTDRKGNRKLTALPRRKEGAGAEATDAADAQSPQEKGMDSAAAGARGNGEESAPAAMTDAGDATEEVARGPEESKDSPATQAESTPQA